MNKASITLFLCATMYGANAVATKYGLSGGLGPNYFSVARYLVGFAAILIVFIRPLIKAMGKDLLVGGLITGVIGGFGNILYVAGLAYTSAGKAAFLCSLFVVMTPVMEWFVKRRKPLATEIIGIILSTAGLALLSLQADFTIAFGDILELLSAVLFAINFFFIEKYSIKVGGQMLSILQIGITLVAAIGVAIVTEPVPAASVFTPTAIAAILFSGLIPVALCTCLHFWAQSIVPPGITAIILIMEPISATVLGAVMLKEVLSVKEFSGIVLMLAGMLIIVAVPAIIEAINKKKESEELA